MEEPLLTPTPRSYWRETRQPIYSAALIIPFLLVYEFGLLFLHSDVINGGDAILLNLGGPLLQKLGLGAGSVSVVALIAFFIGAQIKKKGSWKLHPPLVVASFFESLLYGVLLFVLLSHLLQYMPGRNETRWPRPSPEVQARGLDARANTSRESAQQELVPAASNSGRYRATLRDFVLFCGAGVYEELVFRVLLLGLLILVLTKLFHMEHAYAAAWAVVIGAVIFSAFHHIGGEPFALSPFLQRCFAGLYFAAIYLNRSFGVAAASHALYDILVGIDSHMPR